MITITSLLTSEKRCVAYMNRPELLINKNSDEKMDCFGFITPIIKFLYLSCGVSMGGALDGKKIKVKS